MDGWHKSLPFLIKLEVYVLQSMIEGKVLLDLTDDNFFPESHYSTTVILILRVGHGSL